MKMYLPIVLIVLSNIFYNVCSKSTPENVNPFASLTITYAVGAVVSLLLFLLLNRDTSLIAELKETNWTAWILGLSIVGLEAGSIYMYKLGWNISTGQIFHSAILAICLIFVGAIFYKEKITFAKVSGILICMVGLYFINK